MLLIRNGKNILFLMQFLFVDHLNVFDPIWSGVVSEMIKVLDDNPLNEETTWFCHMYIVHCTIGWVNIGTGQSQPIFYQISTNESCFILNINKKYSLTARGNKYLCKITSLFCLLSDLDVFGTQIGANFAINSLEIVSSQSKVYTIFYAIPGTKTV